MDMGLTDEEMDNLIKDRVVDENTFEYINEQFELQHCKIINKALYIKSGSETDEIKFFTKHTLKDAYEHIACNSEKIGNKPDIL